MPCRVFTDMCEACPAGDRASGAAERLSTTRGATTRCDGTSIRTRTTQTDPDLVHHSTDVGDLEQGAFVLLVRHARTVDEGGRGLFIVAQLAQRWGTRYTAEGKTVWSEQALPHSGLPS